MAAPGEQTPPSYDNYNYIAQPTDGVDEDIMHLNARDDRQVVADSRDIEKPEGELGQVPDGVPDYVINEALAVLRQFRDSPDELKRIKEYINHYRDNYELAELPDPYEGEEADPGPPNDPRVPHDNAPINQSHFEKIGNLIQHVQKFYDQILHNVSAKQQVDEFLGRFCRKIRTIPGCLIATVEFCNESKLLELLKNLHCIAGKIKLKIFHYGILFEKLIKLCPSVGDDFVQELIGLVVNKIRVQISVSLKDILLFLNNNKHPMNIVIQAKVGSLESQESKRTAERNTRFLQRLGKHEAFQNSLKVILACKHGEGDTSKCEETLPDADKKKILETEDSMTKHGHPPGELPKSHHGPTPSSQSASNTPSSHVSSDTGTATETSSSLLSMAHGGLPSSQEPAFDQEPVLHFDKLPGSNMQRQVCMKDLGSLVQKVLPFGKIILDVAVSEDIQTDHETGYTFRSGYCKLESTRDCEAVMSKLGNEKSKAVGFENELLIVSWALCGQL